MLRTTAFYSVTNGNSFNLTDVPSVPQNVEIKSADNKTIVCAWKAPRSDGGSPITGYQVEYKPSNRTTWNALDAEVPDTETVIQNLKPNEKYAVRVRAVNAVGPSDFAETGKATQVQPKKSELRCCFPF